MNRGWMNDPSLTDRERSRAMQEESAALEAELAQLGIRRDVSTDAEELRVMVDRRAEIETRQRAIRDFAATDIERLLNQMRLKSQA